MLLIMWLTHWYLVKSEILISIRSGIGLFGVKLLPEPMMAYCQLNTKGETSAKLKPKHNSFTESEFWNTVCIMSTILFQSQCFKWIMLLAIHRDRPIVISGHGVMRGYLFGPMYWHSCVTNAYESCYERSKAPYDLIEPIDLWRRINASHYNDVIMSAMASQITGVSIVCSDVCSGAD